MAFTCCYGPDSYIISNIGKSILILVIPRIRVDFPSNKSYKLKKCVKH